jgi:hypothetical protein
MSHKRIIGTRAEVWHGTAKKTSGGLTKQALMMNKHGRIVSKAKYHTAKKEMRLVKHGYTAKKGQFGFVKVGSKKHRKGSKKMRGGYGGDINPASVNSPYMMKMVVPQQFSPLDRALVGGKRRKHKKHKFYGKGGNTQTALPAPQFQMLYQDQGGPGTNPNDQIVGLSTNSTQSAARNINDDLATKIKGGGQKSRRQLKRRKNKNKNKTKTKKRRFTK